MKYIENPVITLEIKEAQLAGVRVLLKREDLNHPFVSGNKWWKLKYNLEEALSQGKTTLLTFGGAYSNHLYATAAAAQELSLSSIGIVRGEETLPLNHTLSFAKSQGMDLHYVSRESYRNKNDQKFIDELHKIFGDFYLIPEGGTNQFAIKGVEEFGNKLVREVEFDYVCLPVGTGGTLAGLSNVMSSKKIIGFSSLKGGDFLNKEVRQYSKSETNNWIIETDFHFGGYGKVNQDLVTLINHFHHHYGIPLDPVYTGKMMYGIIELLKQGYFEKGSTILIIHTGGLQGLNSNLLKN